MNNSNNKFPDLTKNITKINMNISKIKIAENGPTFSRIIWGLWRLMNLQVSSEELCNRIKACIDIGITTFDHADIYGNYSCEQFFGDALNKDISLRKKIQLITKCGVVKVSKNSSPDSVNHYDTSKKHIIAAVENSLKNFHTDYLDLLLIHRPDPFMDADEIAEAFTDLKLAGKVLHFGVSNFKHWKFNLLASRLDFPLVTNQIELSVLNFDVLHDGTIDQCQQHKISPLAWSPLGGGRLFTENSSKAMRLRNTLENIREWVGATSIAQVALTWLLNHPAKIIPILSLGFYIPNFG